MLLKFQHFKASTIVSDKGFKKLGKITHQIKMEKKCFEVYKDASIDFNWTKELKKNAKEWNRFFYITI